MDNQKFQRVYWDKSKWALGITMETETYKLLHKPKHLRSHNIIKVNWMLDMQDSFVKSSLESDDCVTDYARPCYTLEIYCSPHWPLSDSDSTGSNVAPG